jgi:hypothetical protein
MVRFSEEPGVRDVARLPVSEVRQVAKFSCYTLHGVRILHRLGNFSLFITSEGD